MEAALMIKKHLFYLAIILALLGIENKGISETDVLCDYEEGQFKNILIDGKYSMGKSAYMTLKIRDINTKEIILYNSDFPSYSICLILSESQKEEVKEWQDVMTCQYYFRISEFEDKKIMGNLIKIWY